MNKIEWIILVTNNYQKSRDFYKKVLGFKVERETPEEEFVQFKLDNCYLAIYGRKQVKLLVGSHNVDSPGGAIYTFAESRDVDRDYKQLKEKGVQFLNPPKTQPWGQRTAYFTDPDGHIWEIQQWMK